MIGERVAGFETELKIALDAGAQARLMKHPALAGLRAARRRTQTLAAVYFDTEGRALEAAGIALRVRKEGRRWVQTVKLAGVAARLGLFARREAEGPAPGGRLALDGGDPVHASVLEAADGAPLAAVFETRVRRTIERLRAPSGGLVELALDQGELVAGARRAPIREAELELLEGEVGALFELAALLFDRGPVHFANRDKASRGYALARGSDPSEDPAPREAGDMGFAADATVETAARDVFRDCLAQIAANLPLVSTSEMPEGPHQLRIGLRRLRTAFMVFEPILGGAAMARLGAVAKDLGQIVGDLRDLDVLIGEVVAEAAATGLDPEARTALGDVLEARRTTLRAEVRAALEDVRTTGFVFDLAAFVEGRGWLAPADWAQSERLATPVAAIAPEVLDRRHRKVMRRGRHLDRLDTPELHALRKELKKLRYTAEMLAPLHPGKAAQRYLKTLKALQETFGSLNDAATAGALLGGDGGIGRDDPAVQRGTGWVLGTLAMRTAADRPTLAARWKKVAAAAPYWS